MWLSLGSVIAHRVIVFPGGRGGIMVVEDIANHHSTKIRDILGVRSAYRKISICFYYYQRIIDIRIG
jgi:hypothetical protein